MQALEVLLEAYSVERRLDDLLLLMAVEGLNLEVAVDMD